MHLTKRSPFLAVAGLLSAAFLCTALPMTARAHDDEKENKHKKDKHEEEEGQNDAPVQGNAVQAVAAPQAQPNVAQPATTSQYHRELAPGGISTRQYGNQGQVVTTRQSEHDSGYGNYDRNDPEYRRTYYSRPRSSFSISFGEGYAGRGYYYGPPNMPYYYDAPGVSYYRSETLIPSQYRGYGGERRSYDQSNVSIEVAVQRALSRRGYYRGTIDGQIGAGSRRAIARFQADQGMRPSGRITQELTEALDI